MNSSLIPKHVHVYLMRSYRKQWIMCKTDAHSHVMVTVANPHHRPHISEGSLPSRPLHLPVAPPGISIPCYLSSPNCLVVPSFTLPQVSVYTLPRLQSLLCLQQGTWATLWSVPAYVSFFKGKDCVSCSSITTVPGTQWVLKQTC